MPDIVQQGGTWGPMLCSNTVDTLGRKCIERNEHCYLYKNTAKILPLAFVDDLNGIAKCGLESKSMNRFLVTQIEMKKLRFHTADKNGKSKCVKMHIGKHNDFCPTLKVHGTIMPEVTEEMYLGDLLSADGKNTKNVKNRVSKGIGIVSQIVDLLENTCFGPHYFKIAMLLRESMLVNGITTNVEVWHSVLESEIEELQNVDKLMFRRLLNVPKSTPIESFYLELGVIPIGVIIKARRVNYLHSILGREQTGMVYSFFVTQWNSPTKGDWTELVQKDLEDLGIPSSFQFIRSKSKEAFKNLVKAKAKEYALKILQIKQNSHKKMKDLKYESIKIQKYFTRSDLSIEQKKLLFKFRTRMSDFGENYRAGREKVICPLCESHVDNQELSFICPDIKNKVVISGKISDIYMEDIKLETVEVIQKITQIRNLED